MNDMKCFYVSMNWDNLQFNEKRVIENFMKKVLEWKKY